MVDFDCVCTCDDVLPKEIYFEYIHSHPSELFRQITNVPTRISNDLSRSPQQSPLFKIYTLLTFCRLPKSTRHHGLASRLVCVQIIIPLLSVSRIPSTAKLAEEYLL